MFAQMRQLPAMAPHIPIEHPTLRQTAYEMMLHAFLLNRADHSILLALVKDWPTHLYCVTTLTEAVLHRSATLAVSHRAAKLGLTESRAMPHVLAPAAAASASVCCAQSLPGCMSRSQLC